MNNPIRPTLYALCICFLTLLLSSCSKDDSPENSMNITAMDPSSPSTLKFNEFVVITFNYTILPEDGAKMWIIPYTDGDRTPGFLYSSSIVFTGEGTRQVGVSVESGDEPVKVDQLKVTMVNPDQSETYIERFESVDYTFEE